MREHAPDAPDECPVQILQLPHSAGGIGTVYQALARSEGAWSHVDDRGGVVPQRPAARRRQAVAAGIGAVMSITLVLLAMRPGGGGGVDRRAALEVVPNSTMWNAATKEVNAWDGLNDPMTDVDAPHGLPDDGTREWNATDFDAFRARADTAAVPATGPLSKTPSFQRYRRGPAPTAV